MTLLASQNKQRAPSKGARLHKRSLWFDKLTNQIRFPSLYGP